MADDEMMARWSSEPNEDGSYELDIPGKVFYSLTHVGGIEVNTEDADGQLFANAGVHWYLDYTERFGAGSIIRRFVTADDLDVEAAKHWAIEVAEKDRGSDARE